MFDVKLRKELNVERRPGFREDRSALVHASRINPDSMFGYNGQVEEVLLRHIMAVGLHHGQYAGTHKGGTA
jgi:hypothetical protein